MEFFNEIFGEVRREVFSANTANTTSIIEFEEGENIFWLSGANGAEEAGLFVGVREGYVTGFAAVTHAFNTTDVDALEGEVGFGEGADIFKQYFTAFRVESVVCLWV